MVRTLFCCLVFVLCAITCHPVVSIACPDITTVAAQERLVTLSADIRYHNHLYYEKMRPVISDAEYDRLYAELDLLEECFPALVATDSPTRTVGAAVTDEKPVEQHERPMLSLSSTTGPAAVKSLLNKMSAAGEAARFLVQPKVDGVPVELTYAAGRLVAASTRGDGRIGENVLATVKKIPGIPRLLAGAFPERVVVRGEVYADRQLMQTSRAFGDGAWGEKYATPRHLAAGMLQTHNPDPEVLAVLRLFPFELVTAALGEGGVRTDAGALQRLADWGFTVSAEQTHLVTTFAEVRAVYKSYLAGRGEQPFAMDGIVVKVDDLAVRQRLGEGARAPFWAAAWKFPPDMARTIVQTIHWSVGRTGRRSPVAEVMPVRLGGVLVSRVSLHNADELARLGVKVGAQVVIALVGDVVPQVVEMVGRTPRDAPLDTVPAQSPESAIDACLRDAPGCREQFLEKAVYFASRSGLNVAGLGRQRLQKLIAAGLVNDLPSIFLLKMEALSAVPGFGRGTARRLTAAIRAASRPDSFRLLTGLGIPGVGPRTASRLAHRFTSLDGLLAAGETQLAALPRGDGRAVKTIRSYFKSPGGRELLEKFREQGVLRS